MHNIAIIGGKPAMGYSGEPPWHDLGSELSRADSVEQALIESNLDWEVFKRPVYLSGRTEVINAEPEDQEIRYLGPEVKDIKAVIRDIDNEVLGTVGNRFTLVQNKEAFAPMQHAIDNHGATIETAGALGNGERVWMLLKLPAIGEVVPGDSIEPYFLVTNSHTRERSQALTARFTPVRVVCQNTLDAAEAGGRNSIAIRHTASALDRISEIEGVILYTLQSYERSLVTYQQLASVPCSVVDMALYCLRVWPLPTEEELEKLDVRLEDYKPSEQLAREQSLYLFEYGHGTELASGSAWTAYNAVTEWIDHVSVMRQDGKKKINGSMNVLFGNGALTKRRALDIALKMFLPQHEEARAEDFI